MPEIKEPEEIRQILETDRIWGAYALGDLDPELFSQSSWYVPRARTNTIALVFQGFDIPVLFTFGETAGIKEILRELELSHRKYFLSVKPEILEELKKDHKITDLFGMWRMVLPTVEEVSKPQRPAPNISQERSLNVRPELMQSVQEQLKQDVTGEWQTIVRERWQDEMHSALQPDGSTDDVSPVLLGMGNFEEIKTLFSDGDATKEAPDFFNAPMLQTGVFYGVYKDSQLVAVSGTHLIVPVEGVAAVGCVYTHREHRGNGYASATCGAVVRELKQRNIKTIVLNVKQTSTSAISVYERLGFVRHCAYYEGIAARP